MSRTLRATVRQEVVQGHDQTRGVVAGGQRRDTCLRKIRKKNLESQLTLKIIGKSLFFSRKSVVSIGSHSWWMF